MKLFTLSRGFNKAEEDSRESEQLKNEADGFKLASNGGYIAALKYALFGLFGYYNARLFITTVPGWEGYLTATFALAGETTALYCFNNYTRSAGNHKTALGVFALLLFAFSFTHASISFFKMEHGSLSGPIQFYCERVAFPVLFGLLLLAAIIIPLSHWRAGVAAEQAKTKAKIETDRAKLVAESANIRSEATLERERLNGLEERIQIGNDYVVRLKSYAAMKNQEREVLASIQDPELRQQLASTFGIPETAFASASTEPKHVQGFNQKPAPQSTGNYQSSNFVYPPNDQSKT